MTIAALAAALAGGCTLDFHGEGDGYGDPLPNDAGIVWVDADNGPWTFTDAMPANDSGGDPWPADDAGGDPWPDIDAGGDPWPTDDAGIGSSCSDITMEAVCVVTPDCDPLYVGVDCQCYQDGTCSCASWDFERCE